MVLVNHPLASVEMSGWDPLVQGKEQGRGHHHD